MSIQAPQGILNIPNATLRVGRLEISEVVGADTALNTIARNTILLVDGETYHENKNWGLKLPNAWAGEFECNTASAGNYSEFNFYNEGASSNAQGYNLTFNDTAAELRYDGTLLKTGTLPSTVTGTGVKKVRLMFERTILSVTVDGTLIFTHDDTGGPRPRVYSTTAGGFLNFFTDGGALKNLKIVNEKWISDGTSNIAYVGGGEVAVGQSLNLQQVSNTSMIKMNSNVVTEFPRSKKLIKYPRVAMSQNDESGTSGYVAGRSSNYQNNPATEAWKMFDGNLSTIWHSENSTGYWNTDGTYDGTSELITGYPGEYVTLQLPANEKVQLHGIRVFPRNLRSIGQSAGAAPKDVVVIGSNNGSSWNVIATTTLTNYSFGTNPSTSTPVGEEYVPATFDFEAMEHYQYVGLIIKTIYPGTHPHVHAAISTLEFLGVPEYDSEAHGTDVAVKSYPNVPNTDWLEIYYDAKDYTSGVVQDLSTNSFNGTLTNGASFNNSDGIDKFVFDAGLNQYMTTTTDISGSAFIHTTSMWVKFVEVSTDSNDQHYLFMLGTFGSNSIGMYYSANHGIRVAPTGFDYRTQYHPVAGKWFHVSYTYAGGAHGTAAMNTTVKFYINGKQWNIPAYHGNTTTVTLPSSSVLQINGSAGNNNTLMDMEVANFRLFNRALTSDEVWQLYAYQTEDFGHGDLSMTLKAGRLNAPSGGIVYPRGRTALDNYEEFTDHSAWGAHSAIAPVNFVTNGAIHYQRVGNFCTASFDYFTASVNGHTYFRADVPERFRPSNPGSGSGPMWPGRTTSNSNFQTLWYYDSSDNVTNGKRWIITSTINGSNFSGGNGTAFQQWKTSISYDI